MAKLHHLIPTRYFNTLGVHDAVLWVSSGDTILTNTVDAGGRDKYGEAVAHAPNPLTGPIYIQDAKPGDRLAVTFIRLQTNRNTGFSGANVAPSIVIPEFVSRLPKERRRAEWVFDLSEGMAHLIKPNISPTQLKIPLSPMLGCFGVAPGGGQIIASDTAGSYGGNMDYRNFTAGSTVVFPVFEEGALFFFGDGHAAQGDGEIVGTGIETSLEVEFKVDLIKGKPRLHNPRAEDNNFLMTVGNARPLEYALQIATTEMICALQEDYGFDMLGAATLLGQCVQYDIGNVFDPAFTIVCKIAKKYLNSC